MLDASRTEDQEEGRGLAVALEEQTPKLRELGERTRRPLVWEEQTHKHRSAAEVAPSRI